MLRAYLSTAAACVSLYPAAAGNVFHRPVTPKKLEEISDTLLPQTMKASRIPGAVVAVVQDDRVLMLRHYGTANLEKGIPVDVDSTLFRVASISKTITATAIMQLWERGQLRLDEDIDVYVGRGTVSRSYADKITVDHLLTHTAGFDTRRVGTWSHTQASQLSLSQAVKLLAPPQIDRPGNIMRYADFDFTLAGYVVEQVSKVPFAAFIDASILKPLQMANSGFTFPPDTDPKLAILYRSSRGRYEKIPEMFPHGVPAAGFVTTAHDMARFMTALMEDKGTILKPSTLSYMQKRHFAAHPQAWGITAGFFENMIDGRRWLVHPGAFSNIIALLPEERTGIFIAVTNSEAYVMNHLLHKLARAIFPAGTVSVKAETSADENGSASFDRRQRQVYALKRFEGAYRSASHPVSTFEKILFFKVPDVTVVETSDGLRLQLPSPTDFTPVGKDLFQPVDPTLDLPVLTFTSGTDGNVNGLVLGWSTYEKLPWYRTRAFYLGTFASTIAVFTGYLVTATLVVIARQYWRAPADAPSLGHVILRSRLLPAICCVINLLTLFGLWLTISAGPYNLFFAFGLPIYVRMVLWIPVIGFLVSVAVCWRSFSEKNISLRRRSAFALVGTAGLALSYLLYDWRLLGFQY